MARPLKFPAELRERAVRMVLESRDSYEHEWTAIRTIAGQLGVSAETLRKWVRRAEVDAGQRPGPTSEELQELARLRRENAELRRANEVLQSAACSFGAELDRRPKK